MKVICNKANTLYTCKEYLHAVPHTPIKVYAWKDVPHDYMCNESEQGCFDMGKHAVNCVCVIVEDKHE